VPAHRHRGGGIPIARVLAIVVALHIVVGGGALWIAKTQSGQEFARVYHIKLFEPPKPEVKKEEAPPPPPPPPVAQKLPPPTPSMSVAKLPASAPAPTIGGGGVNWNGSKFSGDALGKGPEGAFNAAVTGRFRKYYTEPPESFGPAELELTVTGSGAVSAYRLVRSSGLPKNDQAILEAAAHVQADGLGTPPPENRGRRVTVRFIPTSS
jgi:hypothetical protein